VCAGLLWVGQIGLVQAQQALPKANVFIENAWVRAMPASQASTAAYLTLINQGGHPLQIVGATTEPRSQVEMHSSRIVDGMMRMEQLQVVDVPPGKSVEFDPGGMHLMVMGLEKMPAPGERFKLCLEFESMAPVCTEAEVRKVAPSADDARHNHQHN